MKIYLYLGILGILLSGCNSIQPTVNNVNTNKVNSGWSVKKKFLDRMKGTTICVLKSDTVENLDGVKIENEVLKSSIMITSNSENGIIPYIITNHKVLTFEEKARMKFGEVIKTVNFRKLSDKVNSIDFEEQHKFIPYIMNSDTILVEYIVGDKKEHKIYFKHNVTGFKEAMKKCLDLKIVN